MRRSRTIRWVLGGILVLGLGYGLRPDPRPNVVLVTIDSLRADRLPAYGYDGEHTPQIDWLAEGGVVFEEAFTDAPWTTAAMASVFTAKYGPQHGLETPYQQLGDGETTLAEILAAEGYQTAAVVGSFPVDRVFNLAQGFEVYDDRYQLPMVQQPYRREPLVSVFFDDVESNRHFRRLKLEADSYRRDEDVADAAIGWLRRASRRRPFFLWVHFFGAHERRFAGEAMAASVARELRDYDERVAVVDRQVGRLLDELAGIGVLTRSVILVHGDHGQSLLDHGYVGHGAKLYDASLHVPLLMTFPGTLPARLRVGGLVRTIDIMPTVLDLAGAPPRDGVPGRSLLGSIAAGAAPGDGELYCGTLLSATALRSRRVRHRDGWLRLGLERRGIRTSRWKLIVNRPYPRIDSNDPPPVPAELRSAYTTEELYDLRADPAERRNLIRDRADVAARLRARLDAFLGGTGPLRPSGDAAGEGAV